MAAINGCMNYASVGVTFAIFDDKNLRLSSSATCYVVVSDLFNYRACIFLEIVVRIQNVLRRVFYGLTHKLVRARYEFLACSAKGLLRHLYIRSD